MVLRCMTCIKYLLKMISMLVEQDSDSDRRVSFIEGIHMAQGNPDLDLAKSTVCPSAGHEMKARMKS